MTACVFHQVFGRVLRCATTHAPALRTARMQENKEWSKDVATKTATTKMMLRVDGP